MALKCIMRSISENFRDDVTYGVRPRIPNWQIWRWNWFQNNTTTSKRQSVDLLRTDAFLIAKGDLQEVATVGTRVCVAPCRHNLQLTHQMALVARSRQIRSCDRSCDTHTAVPVLTLRINMASKCLPKVFLGFGGNFCLW